MNLAVAIAGKVGAFQQADGDARREQFAVPSPVILVRNLASILGMKNPADARAKWRALRSARSSTLKKCLTGIHIVRDACFRQR